MLMSNGLTEGQAEELALNGHIGGLEGPVVTVVTARGTYRGLHNQKLLASRTDFFPATIVWTIRCVGNSPRTGDADAAFEEVRTGTGWGGRRRRRWLRRRGWLRRFSPRRIWRRIRRVARALNPSRIIAKAKHVARRAWRRVKALAKKIKDGLKNFTKCALGAALPLATGNPMGLAKIGACATKKVNEITSGTKSIFEDTKKEMNVIKNDVTAMKHKTSKAAGVTVAHLYKKGEALKKEIQAKKITGAAAIQRLEDQAVVEIIKNTVNVEGQMQAVTQHAVKGSKIVTKDGVQIAKSAQNLMK